MGPKRIRPVPCELEDLPSLDVILISHNHYDHLDKNTLRDLLKSERHRQAIVVVPLGVKSLLERLHVDTRIRQQIYELNWWEHVDVDGKLRVFMTPAQHWSRRTIWDTNHALWGSFAVIGSTIKFYFAGDTGYCPVFQTIGRYLGPFDCAAIPIGAYHPRWFMSPQHVDPEQALKIHNDIGSRFSIGIHWGTFILTNEYFLEPPQLLRNLIAANKLNLGSFRTLRHGESTPGP
ncbi:N-acyl-phosphatidylethanolamine-hydrolyzing phospholipase D [Galdieria sulphuraria]|nr:N-acyl-phosphatidylethanolamine-hydrolyzing phospholipase D [Galdieria sulphuraria]